MIGRQTGDPEGDVHQPHFLPRATSPLTGDAVAKATQSIILKAEKTNFSN